MAVLVSKERDLHRRNVNRKQVYDHLKVCLVIAVLLIFIGPNAQ